MSRFYFNIHDDICTLDLEGSELPDLQAARAYAVTGARSLAADNVLRGDLTLSHRVDILDEAHQIVDAVSFRDAVRIAP